MTMEVGKQHFIKQCISQYRKVQLTEADRDSVTDLVQRMLDLCSRCVNKAHVELFGSLATGFCTGSADADLSLTYRRFSPWLQGLNEVDEQDRKRLLRVSREAGNMGMENVRFVQARIPVVQFDDPTSGLHCDISIGNLGGVENSKILAEIRAILPEFYGVYVYLVKEWGKRRELIAPEKLMFNSFTMTTMSLMVLQELGLLPVFVPTGEFGELTVSDVRRALEKFRLPPVYEGIEQDDERLGEAVYFSFHRFAEYYSKFDFGRGTVSLTCPRRHRSLYARIVKQHLHLLRERKRREWAVYAGSQGRGDGLAKSGEDFPMKSLDASMHLEAIQRVADTVFVVEDFVNYVNCGRRVPSSRGAMVQREFKRLYEKLRDEPHVSFSEVFETTNALPCVLDPDRPDGRVNVFETKW